MSIEVRELCRSFHGVTALDHVNLTLDDGVIYGLFGRNGAGKSTLLSIIAAHVLPDAGSVTMDGVRVASDGPSLRRLTLCNEQWSYPMWKRLDAVMRMAERRYGGFDRDLAERMLADLGVSPRRRFHQLSRGQRQAFKVLVGICVPADYCLLDEPTAGMDAATRELAYRYMLEAYGRRQRMMIVVSHLIGEIENLTERVIVLDAGRVREQLETDAVAALGYAITGERSAVDAYLREIGTTPLSMQRLGGLVCVGLRGRMPDGVPGGLLVQPMDLQSYVMSVTGEGM